MYRKPLLILLCVICATTSLTLAQEFQFIQNNGQWQKEVLFRTRIDNNTYLFFTQRGPIYKFTDPEDAPEHQHDKHSNQHPKNQTRSQQKHPKEYKVHALHMELIGANKPLIPTPTEIIAAKANFFYGNNHSKTPAPIASGIEYTNAYPGIDLAFKQLDQALKYEFIVAPHTDETNIQFAYKGADTVVLKRDGTLHIEMRFGEIIEAQPIAFQYIAGKKVTIPIAFSLNKGIIAFTLPSGYNKTYPLVIDPVLSFATFSGSRADNWGMTATYDDDKNMYLGGIVLDNGRFPTTIGAYDENYNGGVDVVIMKFARDGNLLYSTYLGGDETEIVQSMIVHDKRLTILGATSSTNFPTTAGAFQRSFGGGRDVRTLSTDFSNGTDLFVTTFSEDGDSLFASTYLGGSDNEGVNTTSLAVYYGDEYRSGVNITTSGDIIIASNTSSVNFPGDRTSNIHNGGLDGVVARLSNDLGSLLATRLIGGSRVDALYDLKQLGGNLVVVGATTSNNAIPSGVALNAYQGGSADGLLGVLNLETLTWVSGRYVGTASHDQILLSDITPRNEVAITGISFGSIRVSSGVYSNANGSHFIRYYSDDLSTLNLSTVIGAGTGTPNLVLTAFFSERMWV